MKIAAMILVAATATLAMGTSSNSAPADSTGVQDLGIDISKAGPTASDRAKFVQALSADQQAALRKKCSVIVAQPSSYAAQVVTFCNDVNNMSGTATATASGSEPASIFATIPEDAFLTYNLIGSEVYNTTHDDIGTIKDIVLQKDRIIGYIVSVGGFLGMGERYAVVQAAALSPNYDTDRQKWISTINATKDQLKNAPEFKYEGRFKR